MELNCAPPIKIFFFKLFTLFSGIDLAKRVDIFFSKIKKKKDKNKE